MKVIEILELEQKLLEMLQRSCIRVNDVQYLPLYNEYTKMMSKGEKKSYVVSFLSEKYRVSERFVYYLVGRLGSDCKIRASE